MQVVLDASVCLQWFLRQDACEPDSDAALGLLNRVHDERIRLLQPPIWLCEIAAVLARMVSDRAQMLTAKLYDIQARIDDSAETLLRATSLSIQLNHHLFDTIYHAVAIENTATLITADAHYYRKAHALGSIALLGQWHPDSIAEPRATYAARPRKPPARLRKKR